MSGTRIHPQSIEAATIAVHRTYEGDFKVNAREVDQHIAPHVERIVRDSALLHTVSLLQRGELKVQDPKTGQEQLVRVTARAQEKLEALLGRATTPAGSATVDGQARPKREPQEPLSWASERMRRGTTSPASTQPPPGLDRMRSIRLASELGGEKWTLFIDWNNTAHLRTEGTDPVQRRTNTYWYNLGEFSEPVPQP